MPLRKLLHKLCGDQKKSKANSPPPPPSRPFTIQTTQSIESFKPQDLWQIAYDQLDEEKQRILLTVKVTANPIDKENRTRTEDLIGEVIHLTKEQYEKYQQNANQRTRTCFRNILNAVLSFKDIIGTAATLDPTQHAASAWAIVSLGLTMTKNHRDQQDALFKSSDYLADVLTQCAFIEKNFYRNTRSGNQQDIENSLIRLYQAILHYTALKLLDSVSPITGNPFTELKVLVNEERESLRRCIEFNEYLHRGEDAEDILSSIDKLTESMKELIEQSSLANLRVAEGAFYNSYANQHEDFCLQNTRTELLQQISKWAGSNGKFIFWLNGMAGTGKSTIARTVAESFQNQGLLGASFFFKRGEADRGNAKYLISTVTRQLVTRYHRLATEVLNAIKNDPNIASKSLSEQCEKLLHQPLMKLHLDQPTTIVIVVDALDECDKEDDIQEIESVCLRVFLTSRPELPIRLGLEQDKNHQGLVLHELPASMVERDIRHERSLSPDWPGNDNVERLVHMAVPLFIFAATACRFIKEGTHPKKRLQKLLEFQVTATATQLDKIYLPVLNQLISDDKDDLKELIEEFQDIVGVIVLLTTPLSIRSLSQLLQISADDISELLDRLHSVLSVPSDREAPVRILHLSFRDYLLITKSPFYIHEQKTHGKIASYCLQVMEARLKHNICGLASYGMQRKDINPQVINQHLTADLQYSCRYWVYHLKQSQGHISESEILSFLKKHFLHWLEALALVGSISDTVEIIDTLMLAIWTGIGTEISDFLYDAKRFALQNTYIADIAPLQLYSSGLVFAPTQSIVKKTFFSEIIRQIQSLPVLEDSWSPSLQTLESHSEWVRSVAFSPDGCTLASGSDDNTIKLWDTTTGIERQTLKGHSDWVRSVAFSPDGRTLASGSCDNTIKLWDTTTGTERQTLEGHSGSVYSVAISPDGCTLASGLGDNTIKLWDITTGTEYQTLEGHSGSVYSVAFSPDGCTLASGSGDDTIKLWDITTGTEYQTLEGSVYSVAISPDGCTLASGLGDNTIKLWDITTGTERQTLEGHSDWVRSVAFSPDRCTLASGSGDNTIRLWDTTTGIECQTLKGHLGLVLSVAFSPDVCTLASGSGDNTIKLWDTITGTECQTLKGHSDWVYSVAFSPDGRTLASGSCDNTIKLWDTTTGIECQTLKGHTDWVNSVAFSPNRHILASGSRDNTIKLWDITTGTEHQTLEGHSSSVNSVAFSPDGRTLVSGSHDNTIKLWDTTTGTERQTLEDHTDSIQVVLNEPTSHLQGIRTGGSAL
ncbi:YVTN repeat-like/Quino protein amine dehydrogenase [Aspergillus alliaceus]|uniref:YVTN repeat-like/Quino protein amine dehydrogenase n=1 Tax=Petromyces alliaceus TaxID=209559 RepID=UPI0012A6F39E|nr:YVTN repeat-like/Quino protein amine dehydrogenase [Aspergillus alliaceus]KAB8238953.1 YVTN repeat-like/Quino protein amine dehydrogenase [Aspergillus alliaceus]